MEKHIKAKNGLDIYSYRLENTHSFYISLYVKMGSMYEDERNCGISHFLEHAVIRNINRILDGELYPLLDRYGLEFNASTYAEMVQFYISGAPSSFAVAAQIIAEVLAPIDLSREDFEAERGRIRAEIREGQERTSLGQFTLEEVFGSCSLSRSITGTGVSVSRTSRRALEEHRRRSFTVGNTFLYVTGRFSDGDICLLSERVEKYPLYSGEIRDNTAPVSKYFGNRQLAVRLKNADYCKVRFTFDLDMSRISLPESDLVHAILVGGYSSELFVEMSERRGLFYDIDSLSDRYKNIGMLAFSFELREAQLYEATELVVGLLKRLKTQILPPERCMHATYVDNAPMLLDSPRELNFTMAYDNHIMDMGYPDLRARASAYGAVTPGRLRELFCMIFTTNNLTFTMKGKRKSVDTKRLEDILARL